MFSRLWSWLLRRRKKKFLRLSKNKLGIFRTREFIQIHIVGEPFVWVLTTEESANLIRFLLLANSLAPVDKSYGFQDVENTKWKAQHQS